MRRRTRDSMSMGENDLLVLRYLLKAEREHRRVSPGELNRYLGVSTASMTAIIDRLERTGHVRRERHETDRRSIHDIPPVATDSEVRATLGAMHDRMLDAVIDLSPEEGVAVLKALEALQTAVDSITPADHASD